MRTAATYIRISKDEEGSVSLDYQRAEIEKLAAQKGLTITAVECDEGISGKSIKARPAVQRILQAVDRREIDAVLVWKSDRLSRDGMESLQIEKLFLQRGVELLSCTEGCLTNDNVEDEFLRFIRAGLNQRERKLISLRTKQALMRKREKGERIGGRPAYGWKIIDGKRMQDPREQAAISRMKELRAAGYSTREITEAVRREGYRTRSGGYFGQTQVCRVLARAA